MAEETYWEESFDDAWSEFEGYRNDLTWYAFAHGWHSRDTEVAELRKQAEGWMHRFIRESQPAAPSVIREARAEALREAALSGMFGTHAQSQLLRMSERIEGGN